MLYIVSGELVPEANQLYHGRMTAMRKHVRIFNWHICHHDIKIKNTCQSKKNVVKYKHIFEKETQKVT